ncbi:TPA: ead/Ea22-like family protein [Salmonella enterica]
MSNIDKQALREHYSPQPSPKCHICGTEMTVQRMSGSRITYGCTGATYDDDGCHYADGRSIADDHYEQSRVTVVDVSDPDVLALLDELETLHPFHTAFTEWHDKTEWVQTDKRFEEIKPWGKHRADVLREFIEHLESKLVAAESGFPTLTVERLMREKESLEERVAELEEIATDYAVQFMRSQDALKHQALLHKSQMEVAEKQVEELTMFVKRLSYSLRNARPDSKLHGAAMDYLRRKGFISVEDVLR